VRLYENLTNKKNQVEFFACILYFGYSDMF
jgi:hypothetical protein